MLALQAGAAGSNPATSTNHLRFNDMLSKLAGDNTFCLSRGATVQILTSPVFFTFVSESRAQALEIFPRQIPFLVFSWGHPAVPTENPIQAVSGNVTLLHCAKSLPQYQFARDEAETASL